MRIKIFVFIIISSIFFSCENEIEQNNNNSDTNNIVDTNNSTVLFSDSTSNNSSVNILNDFSKSAIPLPIKEYLNNNLEVEISYNNDFSSTFTLYDSNNNYTQAKIQDLKQITNQDIICFSFFEKKDDTYNNYFCFFQKHNNNWSNVTQLLVNRNIINYFSTELNIEFRYENVDGFYAYCAYQCNNAILLDFENNSFICLLENNVWKNNTKIQYSEGYIKMGGRDNNYSNMLSANELDQCKHYYSLNEALLDTQKVYIANFASLGINYIDEKITKLKRLQVLILNDNYISEMPDFISELKKLQILRCNNNFLESLPIEIGKLDKIEEISASNNKLKEIPAELSNARNLKILNLNNNLISNIDIDWSKLNQLIIINLSNNNISIIPQSFGDIETLISLDISNNPISNLPENIYSLKNLSYIDVSNTNIPDDQIVDLMGLNADITVVMD